MTQLLNLVENTLLGQTLKLILPHNLVRLSNCARDVFGANLIFNDEANIKPTGKHLATTNTLAYFPAATKKKAF
jgi:hypothetical protein